MTKQTSLAPWSILHTLLTIVSWGLIGWLAYSLLQRPSEPHLMTWFGPGGKELFVKSKPRLARCSIDQRLQLIGRGRHAWSLCREGIFTQGQPSRYPHGLLIRFDLDTLDANASWPFPEKHALYHTVGVAAGPPQTLALVYRANTAEGPLVLAIAGPSRWLLPPTPLAAAPSQHPQGTPRGRLLGMGWQDKHTLRVFWSASSVNDPQGHNAPLHIHDARLPSHPKAKSASSQGLACRGAICRHRPLPPSALCGATGCLPLAAYPSAKGWQLLARTTKGSQLRLATWHPGQPLRWSPAPKAWQPYAFMARKRLDLTLAGLLPLRPVALARRLTHNGTLTTLPRPPRFHMRLQRKGGQYTIAPPPNASHAAKDTPGAPISFGRLRLHHRWIYKPRPAKPGVDLHKDKAPPVQQAIHHLRAANKQKGTFNEGILLERKAYYVPRQFKGKRRWQVVDIRLWLKRLDAYEVTYKREFARSPNNPCLDPATTALLPLPQGPEAYWLLHPSGCHVVLDKQLQRRKSARLITTYRRYSRRSKWHKARIQKQFAGLGWALLGLPFCWLLGLLISPLIRRYQQTLPARSDEDETPLPLKQYPHLASFLATCLYLITALALWPTFGPFF